VQFRKQSSTELVVTLANVRSPVAFPKKTDVNGDFIRKYLPAFRDVPAAYIYEPWKMPKALQERYGVVVGASYPARIVVHEEASKANIERHARAYAANKAVGGSMPAAAPGAGGAGAAQVGSDPAASIAYLRSLAGIALLGPAVGERAIAAAPAGAAGGGDGLVSSAASAGSISGGGAGAASSSVGFKSKARRDSGGGAAAASAASAGGAGDSSHGATGGTGAAATASKRPRKGSS
jgi:hypothetical protein